ncbi:MAG: nucleotidyl transferase AbiEii/AbiGii toxin family protein [Candidatus Margulisiibacteriota bacterium]
MYEVLRKRINEYGQDNRIKLAYIREYLQLLVLKILDEKGYFRNIAFVGGTALRILYDLNRFSEDLDFSLISKQNYSFSKIISELERELKLHNFNIEITCKEDKAVASAFIKFDQLLFDFGLSSHTNQRLSIKLEIDQKPPDGYQCTLDMINKEFLIGINHYDLPSLYSGKLHALLFRKYTKGRDFYDLLWFIGRKVEPNYTLLKNAIKQTENVNYQVDGGKLKELLINKINKTEFSKVKSDMEPFLVDTKEMRFFDKKYFLNILQ